MTCDPQHLFISNGKLYFIQIIIKYVGTCPVGLKKFVFYVGPNKVCYKTLQKHKILITVCY